MPETLTPQEREALQSVVDLGGERVSIGNVASDIGMSATKALHLRLKRLASRGLLSKKESRSGAVWSVTPSGRRLLNGGPKSPDSKKPTLLKPKPTNDKDKFLSEESCPFCGTIGRLFFPAVEMQDAIECLTCKQIGEVITNPRGDRSAVIPGTNVKSFVAANQKHPCSVCNIPIANGTRVYHARSGDLKSVRHVACPEIPKGVSTTMGRKSRDEEAELQRTRLDVISKDGWLTTEKVIEVLGKHPDCRLPTSSAKAPTSVAIYLRRCARTGCILTSDPEMRLSSSDVEWYVPSDIKDYGAREVTRSDITARPAPVTADALLAELRKWTPRPDRLVVERAQKAISALPQNVTLKQLAPLLDGRVFYLKQFEALTKLPTYAARPIINKLMQEKVITEVQWRTPRAYKFLSGNEQPYSKRDYIKACKAFELHRHQTGEEPKFIGEAGTCKTPALIHAVVKADEDVQRYHPPKVEDPPPPKGEHPTAAVLAKKVAANTVTIPKLPANDEEVLALIKEHETKLRDLRCQLFKKHSARVAEELDAQFHEWAQRYSAIEVIVREADDALPYDEDFLYQIKLTLD
jgi:hypothetical protein